MKQKRCQNKTDVKKNKQMSKETTKIDVKTKEKHNMSRQKKIDVKTKQKTKQS